MKFQELRYQKEWEKEMYSYYKQVSSDDKKCLQDIYSRFKQVATACFATGEMQNGDSIRIPTSAPSQVEFIFRKSENSQDCVIFVNTYDRMGNCTELIKPQMEEAVKSHSMEVYESALNQGNYGIGEPFPEGLRRQMRDMIPGEAVVFGKGQMYICTSNSDDKITFIKPCDETLSPSLTRFALEKKTVLDLNNRSDLQKFYDEVKQKHTGSIVGQFTIMNEAQKIINQVYADLNYNNVKVLKFGPVELHAKKRLLARGVSWYDSKGVKIPDAQVKSLIAWLNAAPVVTDFVRNETSYNNFIEDNYVKETLETLYGKKQFAEAYDLMSNYVVENEQSLTIDTKSYVKDDNGDYIATSFIFKDNGGYCDVYKVLYDGNDLNNEISSIKKVSKAEFLQFCAKKYNERTVIIQQELAHQLQNEKSVTKMELNQIVQKAQRKADKVNAVGISPTKENVAALIDSYNVLKKTDKEGLER